MLQNAGQVSGCTQPGHRSVNLAQGCMIIACCRGQAQARKNVFSSLPKVGGCIYAIVQIVTTGLVVLLTLIILNISPGNRYRINILKIVLFGFNDL